MKTLVSALLITTLPGFFALLPAQDLFERADFDRDEILSFSEVTAVLPATRKNVFDKVDQNADGFLDYDEYSLGYSQGFFRPRRLPKSMNMMVNKGHGAPGS